MDINIAYLRTLPQKNFETGLKWMQKLTVEELLQWERETIQEIESYIKQEGREIDNREVIGRLKDQAKLIERDYTLITGY